jgi:hypothetical protein
MRYQRRMVIGEHCAVVDQKVPQVRHLFKVAGNILQVASKVHVIELNIDNVLDSIVIGMQLATAVAGVAVAAISGVIARLSEHACANEHCGCQKSRRDQSSSFHVRSPFVSLMVDRGIVHSRVYVRKAY